MKSSRARIKLAMVLVLATSLVLAAIFLPLGQWLLGVVEWTRDAGPVGMLVFGVAYILATVLMLPGSVLTLGAGFAYGPLWGTLLVSPASVIGATLAFILGRSLARDWVAKKVEKNPKFRAIDDAIAESGFKVVFLLRLSPIFPFNLLNYSLGLTRVKLSHYVAASLIGMLPGTFLYVYLGSLITSGSQLLSGDTPQGGPWAQVLYWGGLLATVAVVVVVTRVARRKLKEALAEHENPPANTQALEA